MGRPHSIPRPSCASPGPSTCSPPVLVLGHLPYWSQRSLNISSKPPTRPAHASTHASCSRSMRSATSHPWRAPHPIFRVPGSREAPPSPERRNPPSRSYSYPWVQSCRRRLCAAQLSDDLWIRATPSPPVDQCAHQQWRRTGNSPIADPPSDAALAQMQYPPNATSASETTTL